MLRSKSFCRKRFGFRALAVHDSSDSAQPKNKNSVPVKAPSSIRLAFPPSKSDGSSAVVQTNATSFRMNLKCPARGSVPAPFGASRGGPDRGVPVAREETHGPDLCVSVREMTVDFENCWGEFLTREDLQWIELRIKISVLADAVHARAHRSP